MPKHFAPISKERYAELLEAETALARADPVLAAAKNLDALLTAAMQHDGPRFQIDVQYGTIAAFQAAVGVWRATREG